MWRPAPKIFLRGPLREAEQGPVATGLFRAWGKASLPQHAPSEVPEAGEKDEEDKVGKEREEGRQAGGV